MPTIKKGTKVPKKAKSVSVNKNAKEKTKDFIKKMLKMADEHEERKLEWEKDSDEKISYAKARLMEIEPFFAMLLFRLPTFACYQIPTMATDGLSLLYNPGFVSQELLRKDVIFVLLHEIEHIFLKHNVRGPIKFVDAKALLEKQMERKDKKVVDIFQDSHIVQMKHMLEEWNIAADYVINDHINTNTSIQASKGLKKNIRFSKQFTDMTSEEVYRKIKTDPPEGEQDPSQGALGDIGIGGILPVGFGDLTEAEIAAVEKEFEGDVKSAALAAQRAGKLPAGVEKVIEDLYTTTTPWQDILRTVFTSINKQDYTFQYPNKRYSMHQVEHGIIMPSLWGEEYVNVGFIMDTSGSVGPKEKSILVSELKKILEDYPIQLHVLYCDTKAYVDNVEVLTRADIQNGKLKLNVKGGGGTDMRPAFDYFRDNQDELEFEVVICLTDMYLFNWNLGVEPPFSTFWARLPQADKNVVPPFGTCVDIELDNEMEY